MYFLPLPLPVSTFPQKYGIKYGNKAFVVRFYSLDLLAMLGFWVLCLNSLTPGQVFVGKAKWEFCCPKCRQTTQHGFPRKGTSLFTTAILVPWERNEKLRPIAKLPGFLQPIKPEVTVMLAFLHSVLHHQTCLYFPVVLQPCIDSKVMKFAWVKSIWLDVNGRKSVVWPCSQSSLLWMGLKSKKNKKKTITI